MNEAAPETPAGSTAAAGLAQAGGDASALDPARSDSARSDPARFDPAHFDVSTLRLSSGQPWPLGASLDADRANFALFSSVASRVELCLYAPGGGEELGRVALRHCSDGVWHVAIDQLPLPVAYGYRVHGPQPTTGAPATGDGSLTASAAGAAGTAAASAVVATAVGISEALGANAAEGAPGVIGGLMLAPSSAAADAVADDSLIRAGVRCNPAKLLLDPYAKQLSGSFRWADEHLEGAQAGHDNAPWMVRALLREPAPFDWADDRLPRTPMAETVIYEAHVKGLTRLHPEVPKALRGTYAGIATPAVIAHLKRIGVTALSLLPVHYAIDEYGLAHRGLVNYWGYNTLGFFAPNPRYAAGDPEQEFREMVRGLHAAGIEVILDVVYNHTAEGSEEGPTLSWRGIDNPAYYRLRHDDPRGYENDTGCGNTVKVAHPRVLQLVLDSLRHWVEHYHVDGFRFDLAVTLGRDDRGFSALAPFFQAVSQDPVLSRVKLIAEPWDIGMDGYRLGGFPVGWSEWNDRYRDEVRAFWIQKAGDRGAFARRLSGSSDIMRGADGGHAGRNPRGRLAVASINFVTAHDGFTLEDLVSYNSKHNEANGENNRDGTSNNQSWNCGVEGPTDLKGVLARRRWLKRAMLATLMLSRGVPMLLAGDELGRSQRGNNNAYCQDNEISWVDWAEADEELIAFVAGLAEVRRRYPELRAPDWLTGEPVTGKRRDVSWINRRGIEMDVRQWSKQQRYVFGMQLASAERRLLVLFNAEAEAWQFPLMPGDWKLVFDTGADEPFAEAGSVCPQTLALQGCSVVLLELAAGDRASADRDRSGR